MGKKIYLLKVKTLCGCSQCYFQHKPCQKYSGDNYCKCVGKIYKRITKKEALKILSKKVIR